MELPFSDAGTSTLVYSLLDIGIPVDRKYGDTEYENKSMHAKKKFRARRREISCVTSIRDMSCWPWHWTVAEGRMAQRPLVLDSWGVLPLPRMDHTLWIVTPFAMIAS